MPAPKGHGRCVRRPLPSAGDSSVAPAASTQTTNAAAEEADDESYSYSEVEEAEEATKVAEEAVEESDDVEEESAEESEDDDDDVETHVVPPEQAVQALQEEAADDEYYSYSSESDDDVAVEETPVATNVFAQEPVATSQPAAEQVEVDLDEEDSESEEYSVSPDSSEEEDLPLKRVQVPALASSPVAANTWQPESAPTAPHKPPTPVAQASLSAPADRKPAARNMITTLAVDRIWKSALAAQRRTAQDKTKSSSASKPFAKALRVDGCQHRKLGKTVNGAYSLIGENHARPVYKQDQPVKEASVVMFYWDDRDGVDEQGWWIAPGIGNDKVWAFCPDVKGVNKEPPSSGWQVPHDARADPNFRLTLKKGAQLLARKDVQKPAGGASAKAEEAPLRRRRDSSGTGAKSSAAAKVASDEEGEVAKRSDKRKSVKKHRKEEKPKKEKKVKEDVRKEIGETRKEKSRKEKKDKEVARKEKDETRKESSKQTSKKPAKERKVETSKHSATRLAKSTREQTPQAESADDQSDNDSGEEQGETGDRRVRCIKRKRRVRKQKVDDRTNEGATAPEEEEAPGPDPPEDTTQVEDPRRMHKGAADSEEEKREEQSEQATRKVVKTRASEPRQSSRSVGRGRSNADFKGLPEDIKRERTEPAGDDRARRDRAAKEDGRRQRSSHRRQGRSRSRKRDADRGRERDRSAKRRDAGRRDSNRSRERCAPRSRNDRSRERKHRSVSRTRRCRSRSRSPQARRRPRDRSRSRGRGGSGRRNRSRRGDSRRRDDRRDERRRDRAASGDRATKDGSSKPCQAEFGDSSQKNAEGDRREDRLPGGTPAKERSRSRDRRAEDEEAEKRKKLDEEEARRRKREEDDRKKREQEDNDRKRREDERKRAEDEERNKAEEEQRVREERWRKKKEEEMAQKKEKEEEMKKQEEALARKRALQRVREEAKRKGEDPAEAEAKYLLEQLTGAGAPASESGGSVSQKPAEAPVQQKQTSDGAGGQAPKQQAQSLATSAAEKEGTCQAPDSGTKAMAKPESEASKQAAGGRASGGPGRPSGWDVKGGEQGAAAAKATAAATQASVAAQQFPPQPPSVFPPLPPSFPPKPPTALAAASPSLSLPTAARTATPAAGQSLLSAAAGSGAAAALGGLAANPAASLAAVLAQRSGALAAALTAQSLTAAAATSSVAVDPAQLLLREFEALVKSVEGAAEEAVGIASRASRANELPVQEAFALCQRVESVEAGLNKKIIDSREFLQKRLPELERGKTQQQILALRQELGKLAQRIQQAGNTASSAIVSAKVAKGNLEKRLAMAAQTTAQAQGGAAAIPIVDTPPSASPQLDSAAVARAQATLSVSAKSKSASLVPPMKAPPVAAPSAQGAATTPPIKAPPSAAAGAHEASMPPPAKNNSWAPPGSQGGPMAPPMHGGPITMYGSQQSSMAPPMSSSSWAPPGAQAPSVAPPVNSGPVSAPTTQNASRTPPMKAGPPMAAPSTHNASMAHPMQGAPYAAPSGQCGTMAPPMQSPSASTHNGQGPASQAAANASPEDRVAQAARMLDQLEGELKLVDGAVEQSEQEAKTSPAPKVRASAQNAASTVQACKATLMATCEIFEGLMRQGNLPPVAMSLGPRTAQLDARIGRAAVKVARLFKDAYEKESYDAEALRVEIGRAIRSAMAEKGAAREADMFAAADKDGDGVVNRDDFLRFLHDCEASASTSQKEALFAHLDVTNAGSLGVEELSRCTRNFYKVVGASTLTDSQNSADGTEVASLRPGEILEMVQGPVRDGSNPGAMRICGRVLRMPLGAAGVSPSGDDDVMGWATVAANDGSAFLVQCPVYLRVAAETPLTWGFSLPDHGDLRPVTVRSLRQDEFLEVLAWERPDPAGRRRARVKAVQDRAAGWATAADLKQGKRFLELA